MRLKKKKKKKKSIGESSSPSGAVLFASYLRSMGLKVLGYRSHLLQRCHPACGHEGSSHLSAVLALWVFIAKQVQHSYSSSKRIELTTSALLVRVRVYLLDHSGDESFLKIKNRVNDTTGCTLVIWRHNRVPLYVRREMS